MGIPYPWDKLDPNLLAFGATESTGLITCRDRVLLAAADKDTLQRQTIMREAMAHEMSHQCFGNLVPQAWWLFALGDTPVLPNKPNKIFNLQAALRV